MHDKTTGRRLTAGDIAGRAVGFGMLAIGLAILASLGILASVAIWGLIL